MIFTPENPDAIAVLWSFGEKAFLVVISAAVAFVFGRGKRNAETSKAQAEAAQITATTETTTWQVSNEALKDWMNKALQAADRINALTALLTEAQIENGKLQREIDDLKDFLKESLQMIHNAGGGQIKGFVSFERKIKKVLEEGGDE